MESGSTRGFVTGPSPPLRRYPSYTSSQASDERGTASARRRQGRRAFPPRVTTPGRYTRYIENWSLFLGSRHAFPTAASPACDPSLPRLLAFLSHKPKLHLSSAVTSPNLLHSVVGYERPDETSHFPSLHAPVLSVSLLSARASLSLPFPLLAPPI